MIGWQWCSGAYGQCRECKTFVSGLWRYFAKPHLSTHEVCAECAERIAAK